MRMLRRDVPRSAAAATGEAVDVEVRGNAVGGKPLGGVLDGYAHLVVRPRRRLSWHL